MTTHLRFLSLAALFFVLFLVFVSKAAPPEKAAKQSGIVFRETTREAGLHKPLQGLLGHGGAWGDVDGDGLIDLFVGGFADRPDEIYKPASSPVPNHLFRNLGNGKFQEIQQKSMRTYARTSGAVFADLDNNGTVELYVANNAKPRGKANKEPQNSARLQFSQLYRNDKGQLTDISAQSGAVSKELQTARNVGVFDYDRDGLLDLYVVEDRFRRGGSRSTLYRNKGNLKFEDVTKKVGLPEDVFGLGLAVADINEDGFPDFFVPHSNRLFLSDGKGKYKEDTTQRDVLGWKPLDYEDWPCGAAFGDLNRDGRLDLVLSIHFEKARNKIFLNQGLKNGVPQFRDVTKDAGFGDIVPTKCPHVEIQDFDNDGWPDIYVSAAWLDDKGNVTPLIYRHRGLKKGIPTFTPPRPIQGPMVYYPAGPSGDYDKDGRIDLFLINWFENNHSRLLHNESERKNWIEVRVEGTKMNRMGIGAQVKIYRAGQQKRTQLLGFQEITIGYGYASGQPALAHFGLGDVEAVDVAVKLPTGKTLWRREQKVNQRITVTE